MKSWVLLVSVGFVAFVCFPSPTSPQLPIIPTVLKLVARIIYKATDLPLDRTLQSVYLSVWNLTKIATDCSELPDLTFYDSNCPRNYFFTDMNRTHKACLSNLTTLMASQSSPTAILKLSACLRDRPEINVALWIEALNIVMLHNPVLGGLAKPSVLQMIPDYQIPGPSIDAALALALLPPSQRTCVVVDGGIGTDNGDENRVWYFREDTYTNLHHFVWHNVYYPFFPALTRADRRGELFYYMHRDILARFNGNRLTNGLPRTKVFNTTEFSEMQLGYITHMINRAANKDWTNRPNNAQFKSVGDLNYSDMETMLARLNAVISSGNILLPDGTQYPLGSFSGIDDFEDLLEASQFSNNPVYYGPFGFHNQGHLMIATSEVGGTIVPPSLMAAQLTSMRDVIFYPWHTFIDGRFDAVKSRLTPYAPVGGDFPLLWSPTLSILAVRIVYDSNAPTTSTFKTKWTSRIGDLPQATEFGFDSESDGVQVCTTSLDYTPFKYEIDIFNPNVMSLLNPTKTTVRIFMAPRFDENGVRFNMTEQRKLFFVLDIFNTTISTGITRLIRSSLDSSLTVKIPNTVRQLINLNNLGQIVTPLCGCGWPNHLLLPKGVTNASNLAVAGTFDLFVMLTDATADSVSDSGTGGANCDSPFIYCGIPGRKYPDAKPMGYPFDRPMRPEVQNLDNFIALAPTTMTSIQTTIFHDDTAPSPPVG